MKSPDYCVLRLEVDKVIYHVDYLVEPRMINNREIDIHSLKWKRLGFQSDSLDKVISMFENRIREQNDRNN
jgi:hypothetical protein